MVPLPCPLGRSAAACVYAAREGTCCWGRQRLLGVLTCSRAVDRACSIVYDVTLLAVHHLYLHPASVCALSNYQIAVTTACCCPPMLLFLLQIFLWRFERPSLGVGLIVAITLGKPRPDYTS